MSDATQALRLLGEMERLENAKGAEQADPVPTRAEERSMTELLALLVKHDFDLGRAIVDTADDA